MSVTKPTLKPDPLDEAPPDALVVLLVLGAAAVLEVVLLVLLLLLLPHAASPRAPAMTRAAKTKRLILPVTCISFPQKRMGNHNRCAGRQGSGLTCSSPCPRSSGPRWRILPAIRSFLTDGLDTFPDGAVAFADGRIVACGSWQEVRGCLPDADVVDARDAVLLPGFVDCHVHFPQVRVIGALGLGLLDWLRSVALPEEARLAEPGVRGVRSPLSSFGHWRRTGRRPRSCSDRTSPGPRRPCSRRRLPRGCGSRVG